MRKKIKFISTLAVFAAVVMIVIAVTTMVITTIVAAAIDRKNK
jgi:hypothetical protein